MVSFVFDSWSQLHYTLYYIMYITFPFQILPKSLCFGIFIVILSCHTAFFCMQTCQCFCCFFFSGIFSPQFVQILQFSAGWLLPWDVAEINSEFLSSADLHVTEGFLVIQVLRLSFSATLHWMILSAFVEHIFWSDHNGELVNRTVS